MRPASVVVVSQGRAEMLERCLKGLAQIDHPDVEVVVVADAASTPAVARSGLGDVVKLVPCEVPNISAARNAGIAQASGEIVAFIDDDAVPEPRWLSHLTAPFADDDVQAAGGFVRGRNGIGFQWRGRMVFDDAETADLPIDGDAPVKLQGAKGRAVKTEGTNMAVRRDTLVALGGFDEAFAFYLDETDLNMRLAARGAVTALVPLAQVHHGYAASARRTGDRVPRTLFEIGASLAVFLRKHHGRAVKGAHRAAQRRRLLRHMIAGRLMPGDVGRLLSTFDAGWNDGLSRSPRLAGDLGTVPDRLIFPTKVRPHEIVFGRSFERKAAMERARAKVREGAVTTLYLWSFTALYHRVRFTKDGVWVQSGGQFGRAERSEPLFRVIPGGARVQAEALRVRALRVPRPTPG
ncbi:glycosyltransferase [Salipiger sp. IMCC34102]|uniref:glycosyltransferase family 2 protein n=1 Tax=Salipiger sp. IMCC34102 TaxID=2510647 RepID=UPI00101DB61B|nr:glycosyltransferase [Salipiger sp. IMCC34102]RYH04159.1 glycosyltransferase [Salipiger sp. IMCC34102]